MTKDQTPTSSGTLNKGSSGLKSRSPPQPEVNIASQDGSDRKLPANSIREIWALNAMFGFIDEMYRFVGANGTKTSPTTSIFSFLSHSILLMVFFFMSIYRNCLYIYRRLKLRVLNLWYYPNKSPQIIRDDVNTLSKIPKKLSCILNFKDEDDENGGIDGLFSDISEVTAWSLSAGILELDIYEYNGVVNNSYLELNRYINKNLRAYFGTEYVPNISVRVPHSNKLVINKPNKPVDLAVNLLSRADGKPTIVELTKTISELAVNKELTVKDISIDLVNEELVELVGLEPDLLIVFNPNLDLQDYPPWHIRLSEIYWEPDNKDVNYAVFIRGLQSYAKSKANVGK